MIYTAARINTIKPFYVMELLAEAKRLEDAGRSIIHFEIGEPDFATPKAVIDAGIEALWNGAIKYTPATGLAKLREAISGSYLSRQAASKAIAIGAGCCDNPPD